MTVSVSCIFLSIYRVLQEQSIAELKRRLVDERRKRELEKAEGKRLSTELQRAQQKIKAYQQRWQQAKNEVWHGYGRNPGK